MRGRGVHFPNPADCGRRWGDALAFDALILAF